MKSQHFRVNVERSEAQTEAGAEGADGFLPAN